MKPPLALVVVAFFSAALALASDGLRPCSGTFRSPVGGVRLLDLSSDPDCSTNRAFGYAVGKQFAASIKDRLAAAGPELRKALDFSRSAEGVSAVKKLTESTAKAFPQYWEEMLGLAEGSGLPLELVQPANARKYISPNLVSRPFSFSIRAQIVLLNFRQELTILADAGGSKAGFDDCSDSMLSFETALLGHNEDNSADTVNTTYFVQAKLNGRSWTAYTYAGELSSAAWGFNDAGISFTLNAVYANEVKVSGVGRNFVSRSVLDAPDLADAIRRVTVANQAAGHNINLIGLDEQQIVTIETGPGNISSVKKLHEETYFHANAFKRLDIPQTPGPSSKHREARAAELKAPRSREDILDILGDTKDKRFPIWRTGTDGEYTLCTALFDLKAENVEIFFDNPKQSQNRTADTLILPLRSLQTS